MGEGRGSEGGGMPATGKMWADACASTLKNIIFKRGNIRKACLNLKSQLPEIFIHRVSVFFQALILMYLKPERYEHFLIKNRSNAAKEEDLQLFDPLNSVHSQYLYCIKNLFYINCFPLA